MTVLLAAVALAGCTASPAPSSRPSSHTADDPKPPGRTAPPPGGPSTSAPARPPTPAANPSSPSAPEAGGARDGRRYAACADGSCQVLVDTPAAILVGRRTLRVSVRDGIVHLGESATGSQTAMTLTGPGGRGRLQTNGSIIDVTVRHLTRGAAVLDIRAS